MESCRADLAYPPYGYSGFEFFRYINVYYKPVSEPDSGNLPSGLYGSYDLYCGKCTSTDPCKNGDVFPCMLPYDSHVWNKIARQPCPSPFKLHDNLSCNRNLSYGYIYFMEYEENRI